METVQEAGSLTNHSYTGFYAGEGVEQNYSTQAKKLKIKELIPWSVCLFIIVGLTGSMKLLKLAVTMEILTSSLFFTALAGLIYCVFRMIAIQRSSIPFDLPNKFKLN